jgi:hypothetical protein
MRIGRCILPFGGGGSLPDPATYCPTNGYIDPTDPEQVEDAGLIPNPILPADGWNLLVEFQTNSPSTATFDPSITATSGEYAWDLGDGTILVGDKSVSHTYLTTATRTVKLYGKGTCAITLVDFNADNIVGELNVSNTAFASVATWNLYNNSSLTSVIFPSVISATVAGIYLHSTGIIGTLDLSKFTSFTSSAVLYLHTISTLTGITWASSITGTFSRIYIYSTGYVGVLDLSKFSSFTNSAALLLYSNMALTGITWASSITGTFSDIHIYSTGYVGVLDLSKFSSFTNSAVLSLQSNSAVTNINWATTITGTFSTIYLHANNITGTLDLSKFSSFTTSATVYLNANPLMTNINWATTIAGTIKVLFIYGNTSLGYTDLTKLNNTAIAALSWDLRNNGWSAAIVNQILANIDSISAAGFTGRVVNVGGTNTDPDTTSGGYNGVAARNSLIAKGFTVTI